MERLTERAENCPDPKEIYGVLVKNHDYVAVAHRLAAYEDTGLTPEEIEQVINAYGRGQTLRTENALRLEAVKGISTDRLRELAEADRAGRLVVLPPKDYTWTIRGDLMLGIIEANCRAAEKALEAKRDVCP